MGQTTVSNGAEEHKCVFTASLWSFISLMLKHMFIWESHPSINRLLNTLASKSLMTACWWTGLQYCTQDALFHNVTSSKSMPQMVSSYLSLLLFPISLFFTCMLKFSSMKLMFVNLTRYNAQLTTESQCGWGCIDYVSKWWSIGSLEWIRLWEKELRQERRTSPKAMQRWLKTWAWWDV